MALPGISNANEFYSAHYLESLLTNDIKKVRERWAEEATAQLQADPLAVETRRHSRNQKLLSQGNIKVGLGVHLAEQASRLPRGGGRWRSRILHGCQQGAHLAALLRREALQLVLQRLAEGGHGEPQKRPVQS